MQLTFADMMVTESNRTSARLQTIHDIVDWKSFGGDLTRIAKRSSMGPMEYLLLSLFKAMILQRFYDLSDSAMEDMIVCRLGSSAALA